MLLENLHQDERSSAVWSWLDRVNNQSNVCLKNIIYCHIKRQTLYFWGGDSEGWVELYSTVCEWVFFNLNLIFKIISLLFFQIHIIDFDDENNTINKNVLLHQAGEIWHIGASPADKSVLTTCYNKSKSLFLFFLFFKTLRILTITIITL